MRIKLLHKALKTLGFPVSEQEEKSHSAGESTLRQVRALQQKFHMKYDDKYIVDGITSRAQKKKLIK
jgi:hypothetical protein